jgi:hypothetical protein
MGICPAVSQGSTVGVSQSLIIRVITYFQVLLLHCIPATPVAYVHNDGRAVTAQRVSQMSPSQWGKEIDARQVTQPALLGSERAHFSVERRYPQTNIVVVKKKVRVYLLARDSPGSASGARFMRDCCLGETCWHTQSPAFQC